jgi:hypothetical protein
MRNLKLQGGERGGGEVLYVSSCLYIDIAAYFLHLNWTHPDTIR